MSLFALHEVVSMDLRGLCTPELKEVLEAYGRRERRMLWKAYHFIKETIDEDPEALLYWEWPHPCHGWSQSPLMAIAHLMEEYGLDWDTCRIDGCRYHLRDHHGHGDLLQKIWMIKTNDNSFHAQFRAKVCCGGHCHGRIEGSETAKTAYYLWQMVQSFTRFWASQSTSNKLIRCMNYHDIPEETFDGDLLPLQAAAAAEDESPERAAPSNEPPSDQERDRWRVKLTHFHKAAGHCSGRNLARIVRDANLEPWKVKMAYDFRCPTCHGLRPGGISSGNVFQLRLTRTSVPGKLLA